MGNRIDYNVSIDNLQMQIDQLAQNVNNAYCINLFIVVTVVLGLGIFINKLEKKINKLESLLSYTIIR